MNTKSKVKDSSVKNKEGTRDLMKDHNDTKNMVYKDWFLIHQTILKVFYYVDPYCLLNNL